MDLDKISREANITVGGQAELQATDFQMSLHRVSSTITPSAKRASERLGHRVVQLEMPPGVRRRIEFPLAVRTHELTRSVVNDAQTWKNTALRVFLSWNRSISSGPRHTEDKRLRGSLKTSPKKF